MVKIEKMFSYNINVGIIDQVSRYNYSRSDVKIYPVFKFYLFYKSSTSVIFLKNYIVFTKYNIWNKITTIITIKYEYMECQ